MYRYKLSKRDFGTRADLIVARQIPELSRQFIKRLSKQDKLYFNDEAIAAGYLIKRAGEIRLDYDLSDLQNIETVELDVIYQDEDILVINKPCGLISHSRSKYWQEASVASSVTNHLDSAELTGLRAGLVHRLDKATSGVMVIAKTALALTRLQQQFSQRSVIKKYLAIIPGQPELPQKGLIDKPIQRHPKQANIFRVDPNGKPSQTEFEILERYPEYTHLAIKPLTGRTHQIRVHLASLKCPVIGDQLYGGQECPRLLLHAAQLTIEHPLSGNNLNFQAPTPEIFEDYKE